MTIEQILDELDERPNALYHIDKYLFPLLDRMLGEHGYQFDQVILGQSWTIWTGTRHGLTAPVYFSIPEEA